MKILMNTDTVGGVWTYAVELCRGLARYPTRIALATAGRRLTASQREQIAPLPHVELYESDFRLEWMPDPWDDVDAAGRWLQQIADRFRPDIVHLNDYSHAARDWPCPVVVVGHSCVYSWFAAVRQAAPGRMWQTYQRRVRLGLQHAATVVAPTQQMLDWLQEFYGPLPDPRVIRNGRRLPPQRELPPATTRQRRILAAGRLWDDGKNIAFLTGIADRLNGQLCLAGEVAPPGGDSADPQDSAKSVHASASYLGHVPGEQMPRLHRTAAIFASPAKYEPFGLGPLEAALCGTPLVLSDIPTFRELWHDAAVLLDPSQPEQWVGAINDLLNDPPRRQALSEGGLARARRYSAGAMVDRYLATYRELISRPLSAKGVA